ncbi:hypothetical protein DFQ27_005936 [Actinomortierella ambigua]|uniref:Zinc finger PHD-type domain-containing protein n=1 Tax=Actinomortierella ambigua TaxID=1343610 RepID=A0A9P6U166_9FUNG|nr:hypothetical protein DFQ27_005936 [Actinomortierella ambigua]
MMSSKNTPATASSPFHYPLPHSLPFTFHQHHHQQQQQLHLQQQQQQLHHHLAAATLVSPLPSPALSAHDALNPWASISIINGGANVVCSAALTPSSLSTTLSSTPAAAAIPPTPATTSTSSTTTTTTSAAAAGVVPPSATTATTTSTTATTTTAAAKGVYANHFSSAAHQHHHPLSSSPPTVTSQQHLLPPVSVPSQNPSPMPSSISASASTPVPSSVSSSFASTFCGSCKSKLTKAHKIMPYSNREAMLDDLCNKCKKHCYALSLSVAVPTVAVTAASSTPVAPIHHSLENSTISFDGSSQQKNVINDVFLSTSMLQDDADFYLHETSSSVFDSDSDTGLASPPTQSAPMTPMTPFLEHDEDHLYGPEAVKDIHDDDLLHSEHDDDVSVATEQQPNDLSMVVDMKRPMFIPVSICDPRDFSMTGCLPTPPEINARKHSYDFLRQSEGLFPGGLAAIKRRRMVSVDMMNDAPASPPASTAGDDETELSDADSQGFSFNTFRRKSIFHQSFRQLTPTSPSLSSDTPCFVPTASPDDDDSDGFELHPELAHSEDESEDDDEDVDGDNATNNSINGCCNYKSGANYINCGSDADTLAGHLESVSMPTDVFIAPQDTDHGYMTDNHFSFSEADEEDDDEDQDEDAFDHSFALGEVEEQVNHAEGDMDVDAMSSSDESDSDMSDMEDYQFQVKRRGTWHGPTLAMKETASAAALAWIPEPETFRQKIHSRTTKQAAKNSATAPTTKAKATSTRRAASPATTASAKAAAATSKAEKADKAEEKPTKATTTAAAAAAAEKKEAVAAALKSASTTATAEKSLTVSNKSAKPLTLFQILTKANIDWCRYCGTTEGVNWRPGPWGKRTLCNKHGCDFKGYGFACKLPRLDLTSYAHETVEQRIRPVLQHFCHGCQSQESLAGNLLVRCEGCPKAFHQKCHGETTIPDAIAKSEEPWFCDEGCRENIKKRRVCVELPKKRLPLMSTPKPNAPSGAGGSAAGSASSSSSSSESGRSRASRASVSGETVSRK